MRSHFYMQALILYLGSCCVNLILSPVRRYETSSGGLGFGGDYILLDGGQALAEAMIR